VSARRREASAHDSGHGPASGHRGAADAADVVALGRVETASTDDRPRRDRDDGEGRHAHPDHQPIRTQSGIGLERSRHAEGERGRKCVGDRGSKRRGDDCRYPAFDRPLDGDVAVTPTQGQHGEALVVALVEVGGDDGLDDPDLTMRGEEGEGEHHQRRGIIELRR
jgi:hypothetical protein